jgi:rubrerythrin
MIEYAEPKLQDYADTRIDVAVVWYCRGCKRSVDAIVEADAKVKVCPQCGAEAPRFG